MTEVPITCTVSIPIPTEPQTPCDVRCTHCGAQIGDKCVAEFSGDEVHWHEVRRLALGHARDEWFRWADALGVRYGEEKPRRYGYFPRAS